MQMFYDTSFSGYPFLKCTFIVYAQMERFGSIQTRFSRRAVFLETTAHSLLILFSFSRFRGDLFMMQAVGTGRHAKDIPESTCKFAAVVIPVFPGDLQNREVRRTKISRGSMHFS